MFGHWVPTWCNYLGYCGYFGLYIPEWFPRNEIWRLYPPLVPVGSASLWDYLWRAVAMHFLNYRVSSFQHCAFLTMRKYYQKCFSVFRFKVPKMLLYNLLSSFTYLEMNFEWKCKIIFYSCSSDLKSLP